MSKKLKCRYEREPLINAYFIYCFQDFWRDIKLKRDLTYYETKLVESTKKYNLVKENIIPIYIEKSYAKYISILKPLLDKVFEKECNVVYPLGFENWKEFCDEM